MKRLTIIILFSILLMSLLMAVQRDKVLVEIGTGTWCVYCPGAAMGANDLVNNGHQVAIIKNHSGDPFANTYSNARNTYYGISSFPTAYFDGANPTIGGSFSVSMYSNYLPKVNARLAVPSNYTINATGNENAGTYTANVTVDKVSTDTNSNLRLHFAITQSRIQHNWQGQTHVESVTRLMVPSSSGTTVDLSTQSQVSVPLTFTMNPAWPVGNCEIVVFLQNNTSKEVLQCVKYSFPEFFVAYPVSATELNFPTTYITGTSTIPLTINNYWANQLTGTISSNNPAFTINPGNMNNFTIPPYSSLTYNVTFSPTIESTETGTITITGNIPDYPVINIPMTATGFLNAAPIVTYVAVTGIPVITMVLNTSYTFTDSDNDMEGSSLIQWYRHLPGSTMLIPITGATTNSYRVQHLDLGYQLTYKLTPFDEHAMPGTSVYAVSTSTIGALPVPQNLTANVINNQDVVLNWDPPAPFTRDFLGYKLFRNGLNINFITNPSITSFTDTWLNPGEYQYWITSVFNNPSSQSEPSNIVMVNITSNSENTIQIGEFVRIHPNPFYENAIIDISSKASTPVEIKVYNIKGQTVLSHFETTDNQGKLNFSLNRGHDLLSGVYFIAVITPSGNNVNKVVLLK